MKIEKFIERRLRVEGQKFWFTSMAAQSDYDGKWSNCLYINFVKEDFPSLSYPALIKGWREGQERFDYNHCDIAEMDWHCGITFYQETYNPEYKKTMVKAGCDFQHLYDDHWREDDHGKQVLERYTPLLTNQFLKLIEKGLTPSTSSEGLQEREG